MEKEKGREEEGEMKDGERETNKREGGIDSERGKKGGGERGKEKPFLQIGLERKNKEEEGHFLCCQP